MNRITALAVVAVALATTGFTNRGTWIIDPESLLTIAGTTNVNRFVCKINYFTGTDTLQYIENTSTAQLRFTRSRITIPVMDFNCGAKPISKDFWKTLRAETHPNLEIKFISLDKIKFKDESNIKGVVDITLAGYTTRYAISYKVSQQPNGTVRLKGRHAVRFADFQLVAPQKLKGLIKVNEGLTVDFNLVLKKV